MSKIGDLFIKLGLKKQDFDKGIDEAENQVKGFSLSTKAMATAAAAAWAAVAAAVVKFAKDAVKMTQTWGDQWNVTMAGVKGAYSAFVRQLASGEGFDHLFSNMREAARVAREVAKALDEVFERTISGNYQTAQIDNEIADWQKAMRDMSKTEQERTDAANKVKDLTAQRYQILKDIAKQEGDTYRAAFQSQTGLNNEQTDFLVKEYNQNRELINQARQYREERAKAYSAAVQANKTGNVGGVNFVAVNDAMKAFDAQYSESVKTVAAWTKLYDKGNDELVSNMAKAEVQVINLDTQAKHATDQADRLLGRFNKEDGGGKTVISKQAEESVDSLKVLEEALDRADRKRKALMESHEDVVPVTVDVFGIDADIEAMDAEFDTLFQDIDEHYSRLLEERDKWRDAMEEMGQAVAGGFSDACQELMNQLMGLDDFNPGAVVKALLEPLADMAIKAGEIIVAEGIAVEAARAALSSFAGYGAIVAGALLIAAGTAAKAGLAALAKGGSTSATTASNYGGNGSGGTTTQNIETELTITVEGRISGSDIVLAGQKTLDSWNR